MEAFIFTVIYWACYWATVVWSCKTDKSYDLTLDEYLIPITLFWAGAVIWLYFS